MVSSTNPAHEEANEMFSKTRTIIITLVAALSVAGVASVPTVAQAAQKESKQEAKKSCEGLFKLFESSVNRMEGALKAGNSAEFNDAKGTAENALTLYEAGGCDSVLALKLRPMPTRPIIGIYKPISTPTRLA
jgi:hypothetical protein